MDGAYVDISSLIPHQGAMCLLDRIETWDEAHIVCRSTSHRRLDHPLRDDSGLRALCGIEYGAQAIAVHTALLADPAGHSRSFGLLAFARDVTTSRSHLDDVDGPLTIHATLVLRHDRGCIYDILLTGGGQTVVTGRLSVMAASDHLPMSRSLAAEDSV